MPSIELSRIDLNVCFYLKGNYLLMQQRVNEPNIGQWNALGGHIETGESKESSTIREFLEESSITLLPSELLYRGIVTWHSQEKLWESGGMYLFIAYHNPKHNLPKTPLQTREGMLDFKPLDWATNLTNTQIFSNIPYFLPTALSHDQPLEHRFVYNSKNRIVEHTTRSL